MVITTAKMLSHVIREFRYQGDLSQTDVAKLSGTTQARISAFENEPERTKLELIVQPRKKSSDTARSIKEPTATYDDDEAW